MTQRTDIHHRLAHALRDARKQRGLSLDAVSKLSGVSRSMVSQIERGESSPTVAILWNLTRALQIDFSNLMEPKPAPMISVVRSAAAPVMQRPEGIKIRILSPADAVGDHEVYELNFATGAALTSEAHSTGCREHLTVLSGRLTLTIGDEEERLSMGDVAHYPADRPHQIKAEAGPARAILIVQGS